MALRITTPPSSRPEALDPVSTAVRLKAAGQESAVSDLIAQKTTTAEELAGLKIWYRGYSSRVQGDGDDRLYLRARPLVAVSSVSLSGGDPLTEGTEPDDFELWEEAGYLYRENCWERGRPGWTVDFTAGWWLPSMPDGEFVVSGAAKLEADRPDITLAVYEMVALQWQIDKGDRTIKGGSVSGVSAVQYREDQWIPKTAHQTLSQLRPLLA